MSRVAVAALLAFALGSFPSAAHALRPFDGTDADVAETGAFELELGPAQYYAQAERHYLSAPIFVLNLGIAQDLELVIDGRQVVALEQGPDRSHVALLDDDVFLKWVARRGALQGGEGLSIAFEGGPLLPEVNGDKGFGAQLDSIATYRWTKGMAHFNEQIGWSRLGHPTIFSSIIFEGRRERVVRPVAELLVSDELREHVTLSMLLGALWSATETLTMDLGLRVGRVDAERAAEVRLGFTWAIPLWEPRTSSQSRGTRLSARR